MAAVATEPTVENDARLYLKYVYAVNTETWRKNITDHASKVHTSEDELQFCDLSVWCDPDGRLDKKEIKEGIAV